MSFNIEAHHAPQNNVRTVPGTLCCRCRSCMWHLRATLLLSKPCHQQPAYISELSLPPGATIAFVDGKGKLLPLCTESLLSNPCRHFGADPAAGGDHRLCGR